MSQPIRIGVVGYGMSANVFHIPFLTTHPGYQLTSSLSGLMFLRYF